MTALASWFARRYRPCPVQHLAHVLDLPRNKVRDLLRQLAEDDRIDLTITMQEDIAVLRLTPRPPTAPPDSALLAYQSWLAALFDQMQRTLRALHKAVAALDAIWARPDTTRASTARDLLVSAGARFTDQARTYVDESLLRSAESGLPPDVLA